MNPDTKSRNFALGKTLLRCVLSIALVAVAFTAPKPAFAGRLGTDVIALFPKEVGEFAYADLKAARAQKWFPQLQEQMLPERFRQFEKFLAAAGVDPNSQVEELAWGLVAQTGTGSDTPTGEEIVGVALGNFNPESTEAYFKAQKLPSSQSRGFTLYAFGSGSGASDLFFFFIDSNTAAFGHRDTLEKMIEVRFGAAEGLMRNDQFFSLISEVNGTGVVWMVLNPAYTHLAVQQLAPELQQFPDAVKLVARMKNMLITIKADSGVTGDFQTVCASTDDANALGQLMQMGLLFQQYQAKTKNPDLAQLLSQATVTPAGDRVTVHMTLTDDQIASLIQHNMFSLKM